jgi:hypothetical protein
MAISKDSSTPSAPPGQSSGVPGGPGALNPAALAVEQLARMLGVPAQKVQQHVDAGAPTGPGGTINLVHYVAWLNRELARTDGD